MHSIRISSPLALQKLPDVSASVSPIRDLFPIYTSIWLKMKQNLRHGAFRILSFALYTTNVLAYLLLGL
jgi:hypothetical protein